MCICTLGGTEFQFVARQLQSDFSVRTILKRSMHFWHLFRRIPVITCDLANKSKTYGLSL